MSRQKLILLLSALCALMFGMTSQISANTSSTSTKKTRWGKDWFPNFTLTREDGETVQFYDDLIHDKIVVVNFIFTSCPYSCPLETAKLKQVYDELGDRVGRDIFLYSISIDPENDTPAVLKAYKEKFKIGKGWQFFTGNKSEIDNIRTKLGLLSATNPEEDLSDHNLRFVLGNSKTGQWRRRSPMDNPALIARLLMDDLQNYKEARGEEDSYADAPKLPPELNGETIFRTRCQACHTIGGGDGVGPDLLGVTKKREAAWLRLIIQSPEEMLASKDPIAMGLLEKFDNVPMPNLQLNDSDVLAIIKYLERH